MKRRFAFPCLPALLVAAFAAAAPAADVTIGAGSSLDLGTNNIQFGCADLTVGGTLQGNSGGLNLVRNVSILPGSVFQGGLGAFYLAGSWSNQGQFVPGMSSVNFTDGCAQTVSTISGDTTFFDLEALSVLGKILEFEAGSVTTVTNQLVLAGVPGNRLQIRSSVAGVVAYLEVQAAQFVADVEVQDNQAIGKPILMGTSSQSLGNTPGWWAAYAVPAASGIALAGLAACVLYVGRQLLQRRGCAPG